MPWPTAGRGKLLVGMVLVAAAAMLLDSAARQAMVRWLGLGDGHAGIAKAGTSTSPWDASYFPNPVLTDQFGRQLRLYDDLLKGKTVAVNTFFTVCADVCPLGTAKMRELQRLLGSRMGRDIFFLSLSVDPLRDSPEALRQYADRYDIGPGWLLLTGKAEDIALVTRKLGLGTLQQTAARESHSTTLSVGHVPTGRWMKNRSTDNPQFLAAHMATFLGWPAEAASQAQTDARVLKIGQGEFLFRNACAACHDIGGGRKIGPDLLGVGQRRPHDWLVRFILAPDQVLDSDDPVARQLLHDHKGVRMPNLGLRPDEALELLAYIDARSAQARATSATGLRGQP